MIFMCDDTAHTDDLLKWAPRESDDSPQRFEPFFSRPFGTAIHDLDLSFGQIPAAHLTTQLLANCTVDDGLRPFADGEIWGWSLARRLRGLLAIMCATNGHRLGMQFDCPYPDCDGIFAMELDLASVDDGTAQERISCRLADGTGLTLRQPTGSDQRDWIARGCSYVEDWSRRMAAALVVDVDDEPVAPDFVVPDEWIASALEVHDPTTCLTLDVTCPYCNQRARLPLDLEASIHRELARERDDALDDIHRLASAYHWSESEIMGLPRHRRRAYLDRLLRGSA